MSSKRFLAAALARPARVLAVLALAAGPCVAAAQTATPAVSMIVSFSGTVPVGNLVRGDDGALYGATVTSFSSVTTGLIYRAALDGSSISTLYQLKDEDGQTPQAGLLLGSDGKLYGSTKFGRTGSSDTTGTIYRVDQDGKNFVVLHRFAAFTASNAASSPINTDGAYPSAELIEGTDGNLYGITGAGGANGTGVVFRLARDGTGFQVLHEFSAITNPNDTAGTLRKNVEGMGSVAPLVQATDGKLYGTAAGGGSTGRGTIFRLNTDGTGFEVLRTFPTTTANSTTGLLENSDGYSVLAGLLDANDGFLYGVASLGGTKGHGTIFAITPDGQTFVNLHNFEGTDGTGPVGDLALFADGKLYGSTTGGGTKADGTATNFGTLFSMARDGTGFTKLYSFDGTNGTGPNSKLLQIDASTLVGTSGSGGKCGSGTLYQYSATGATVTGNTTCGQKKNNNSGGGSTAPAMLLLLGGLGLMRRRVY